MKTVFYYSIMCLLFLVTSCMNQSGEPISIKNCLCEYTENPINVDLAQPRFSWILESNHRNQKQTAFCRDPEKK